MGIIPIDIAFQNGIFDSSGGRTVVEKSKDASDILIGILRRRPRPLTSKRF